MGTTQYVRTGINYRAELKRQGRSVNWLVGELNQRRTVSRQHVSRLLNDRHPISPEWERLLNDILGTSFYFGQEVSMANDSSPRKYRREP